MFEEMEIAAIELEDAADRLIDAATAMKPSDGTEEIRLSAALSAALIDVREMVDIGVLLLSQHLAVEPPIFEPPIFEPPPSAVTTDIQLRALLTRVAILLLNEGTTPSTIVVLIDGAQLGGVRPVGDIKPETYAAIDAIYLDLLNKVTFTEGQASDLIDRIADFLTGQQELPPLVISPTERGVNLAAPITEWSTDRGAVLTRDGGEAIIRFVGPSGERPNPVAIGNRIDLVAGKTYTFSFEQRSRDAALPMGLFSYLRIFDAAGRGRNDNGSMFMNTAADNVWEDCSWRYTAKPADVACQMQVDLFVESTSSTVEIRDPYIGADGGTFRNPNMPKVEHGVMGDPYHVRADGSIWLSGEPFWSTSMFVNPQRFNLAPIAAAGWNTNAWVTPGSMEQAQRCADAGMHFWWQVAPYAFEDGWKWQGRYEKLIGEYEALMARPDLARWFLGTYLDNENHFFEHHRVDTLAGVCRDLHQQFDNRIHYTLNGNWGVARSYQGDITGSYVRWADGTVGDTGNANGAEGSVESLENLCSVPVGFQQINGVSPAAFRPTLIRQIDNGAMGGVGFFSDGVWAADLEDQAWFANSAVDLAAARAHWLTKL
jgi:hypothetical protein